jgi:uncharacterized protein with HEPN domain
MNKDPSLYVDHMLEAIANIATDTAGYDFERFRRDRRVRQLVERNLEIISEASRRLPQAAKDEERQIPWRAIAGIGNVIRHDYHDTYPTAVGNLQQGFAAPEDRTHAHPCGDRRPERAKVGPASTGRRLCRRYDSATMTADSSGRNRRCVDVACRGSCSAPRCR